METIGHRAIRRRFQAGVDTSGAAPTDTDTGRILRSVGVGSASNESDRTSTDVRVRSDRPAASLESDAGRFDVSVIGVAATGSTRQSNTLVYDNVAQDLSVAVVAIPDGAQFAAVLKSPRAAATQRYKLSLPDGVSLQETGDGGYLLLKGTRLVGQIEAPWALDAAGRSLPTEYHLDGDELTQRTRTDGATYPVVVDPKISVGRYIYIRFNPTERRELAQVIAQAGGAVTGALICSRGGGVAVAVCSAVGTVAATVVFQTLYTLRANRPECGLEVRLYYSGGMHGSRLIQGDSSQDC